MEDHSDATTAGHEAEDTGGAGTTRRDVLRRGALVGGALLAAQSLGTISAMARTSPPPGSNGRGGGRGGGRGNGRGGGRGNGRGSGRG